GHLLTKCPSVRSSLRHPTASITNPFGRLGFVASELSSDPARKCAWICEICCICWLVWRDGHVWPRSQGTARFLCILSPVSKVNSAPRHSGKSLLFRKQEFYSLVGGCSHGPKNCEEQHR